MSKIRNLAFDLGGVVIALSYEQAVARFEEIGLRDARQHLDAYHQHGIFGDLELGKVTMEQFRQELARLTGRDITIDDCLYAWHGYVESVPQRNLDALLRLRSMGYQVCLLSNTNPFMMSWAFSPDFDGRGNSIVRYFDALYLSYELQMMKPSPEIFEAMLAGQDATPEETLFIDDSHANVEAAERLGIRTLCPQNNADWTTDLLAILREAGL